MAGSKILFLASPQGEVAELVFSTVREAYSFYLDKYRSLREERDRLEKLLTTLPERVKELESAILLLQGSVENFRLTFTILVIASLVFLALSFTGTAWFTIFMFAVFLSFILYGLKSSREKKLQELQEELLKLKNEIIPRHTEELKVVTNQLSSFKLPDLKLRAYKVYVPVGFTSFNGNLLAVAPFGEKLRLSLKFTFEAEELTRSLREIQRASEFYRDTVIKEKLEGSSVVSALEKVGLWDKVRSARSPEYLLAEVVSREVNRLLGLVQEKEVELTLVPPVDENVRLIKQALSEAAAGMIARDRVLKGSEEYLSDLFSRIEELQTLAQYLQAVEDFIVDAESVKRESRDYRELKSRLIELVEATVPVEPFTGFAERVYCKSCADRVLEDIIRRIDLKRWVEVNILGGVSEDPDIVVPIPELLEDVRASYSRIEDLLLARLPLPASGAGARTKELYEKGLRTFAIALSAADEHVRSRFSSPFEEPVFECEKCGSSLAPDTSYTVSTLALPFIRAYVGTMYELADAMYGKSESIRLSINEARLAKDQRKSGLGIYEQMLRENEIRREALQDELDRLREHKARLLALASALAVSVGVEIDLEAIASGRPVVRGD
ncbi:MAG: hypothetical protein QXJ21_06765 [Thermofilum sp.]